jgi:hypothetical protein
MNQWAWEESVLTYIILSASHLQSILLLKSRRKDIENKSIPVLLPVQGKKDKADVLLIER